MPSPDCMECGWWCPSQSSTREQWWAGDLVENAYTLAHHYSSVVLNCPEFFYGFTVACLGVGSAFLNSVVNTLTNTFSVSLEMYTSLLGLSKNEKRAPIPQAILSQWRRIGKECILLLAVLVRRRYTTKLLKTTYNDRKRPNCVCRCRYHIYMVCTTMWAH